MVERNADGEVRSAGGVAWRSGDSGIEVLLVHRGEYDDWTIPKGKVDPGESDEECALREVEEETGLRARLGRELPSIRWVDRFGRPKIARYWLLDIEPSGPEARPQNEVDAVEWLPLSDAILRLSYPRDAEVLGAIVPDGKTRR